MKIRYNNKVYESVYDVKTNTVGVTNPDDDILKVINDDRIQRGLLMGELLCIAVYNLDEPLKNKKL